MFMTNPHFINWSESFSKNGMQHVEYNTEPFET